MGKITGQMEKWAGKFGMAYIDRNPQTAKEYDELYIKNYGVTKTSLNKLFLEGIDRSIKILEVGSNIGIQLVLLQDMGFKNLYGIELNRHAIERSKSITKGIDIIQGSAFDIPFKDRYFGLVFTSGVLIHISPVDIGVVVNEIHRCAGEYIMGFEYYAKEYQKVTYRGEDDLLWKTDFVKIYTDNSRDIELVKRKKLTYLANKDMIDEMFLFKKRDA